MRRRTHRRSSSNRDISEIPANEICLIKVAARCVEIMEYLSRGSTPLSEVQDVQEEFFGFSYANLSKKLKAYQKIAYKYTIKLFCSHGMISINHGRENERAAAFVKDVRAEFDRRFKNLRDSIVRLLPDTEAVTIKQVYQRYKQAGFTLVDNMKQFFELANCLDPRSFCISLQGDNRYFSEIVFTEKNKEFYVRRVQDFDSYPSEISEFLSHVDPLEDLSMYELESIQGLERLTKLIDAKGGEADETGLKYANKALYGREISDDVMHYWGHFDFTDSKRCPFRISRSGAMFKSDEYGYRYDVLTDYMDKVRAEYDKRLEITRERFLEFLKTGRLNLHELCVKYGRRFNEEPFTKQDLFLLASTKDEETFLRRIEGDDINKAKIIFYRDANSIVYLQRASDYMIDHVFEETRIYEEDRREVEEDAREREARKGDWVPKRFTLDYYSPENSDVGEYSFRREPYSCYPDDNYSSGERERARSESDDAPDSDVTPSTATSSDEEERRAKNKKRRKRIRTPSVTSRSPSPSRKFHKKSARTHQKQEVKLSPEQSKVKSSKQKQMRLETKGKDGNSSNIMPPPDRSISRFESSSENHPQPVIVTSSPRKSPKMSATSSSMDQEVEKGR